MVYKTALGDSFFLSRVNLKATENDIKQRQICEN